MARYLADLYLSVRIGHVVLVIVNFKEDMMDGVCSTNG